MDQLSPALPGFFVLDTLLNQRKECLMLTFRKVVGIVLAALTASSSSLAIAGIWGWIEGDTVWQMLLTFFVVGLATIGLSYVTSTFFDEKK